MKTRNLESLIPMILAILLIAGVLAFVNELRAQRSTNATTMTGVSVSAQ